MWSLYVLPMFVWVIRDSSHNPKQVRLTGNSKLPVGVNVSVNGCLSPCVSPVKNWRLVQGVPHLANVSSD